MNKKLLYQLLAVLVIASFVLTACGGQPGTVAEANSNCAGKLPGETVTIGSGNQAHTITCDGSSYVPNSAQVSYCSDDSQPETIPVKNTKGDNVDLACSIVLANKDLEVAAESEDAATEVPGEPTFTPTVTFTPTITMTPVFTATPTSTLAPTATTVSCLTTLPKSVNSNNVTWEINGDIGDRNMHGIASWVNKDGVKMLTVTQKLFNVDVETAKMTVHWIYTTVPMDAVFCAADELAKAEGISQKFYVGLGNVPEGYSTELDTAEGFAVHFTMFTGEEIDTAPAHWDTIPFAIGTSHVFTANEGEQVYGQMQSGNNRAQHFQVREGFSLSTPDYQGTRWVVTNWHTVLDRLIARFTQMTQEVVQRDDGVIIEAKVFCGSADEIVPPGYLRAEDVSGYTCTKLP
jgi:hypothetical protein